MRNSVIRITAAWLAPALLLTPIATVAGELAALLPPEQNVVMVLPNSPAYLATLSSIDAARSVHRQLQVGPHEWIGSASVARRRESSPQAETTREWELGLDRTVRLPGKAQAYDNAGQARVEQAAAERAKVWREQARRLLELQRDWLRESESARVWAMQLKLLRQQSDSVAKRRRLGDAARIEQQQSEAALVQARAQADSASRRSSAVHEALGRQFPGLLAIQRIAIPAPQPLARSDEQWLDAQIERDPQLQLARAEVQNARAQLRVESAETRPDPTLGLRVGRARSGVEEYVGVVVSVPFGGAYRRAGAAAATARASAAEQQLDHAQRSAEADAVLRLREARTAYSSWLGNQDAAQRLAAAATSLARGYQLGEGSLSDVLTARRLANEQQLAASVGAVDAWMSRIRLEIESGMLWTDPNPVTSNASNAPPGLPIKQ